MGRKEKGRQLSKVDEICSGWVGGGLIESYKKNFRHRKQRTKIRRIYGSFSTHVRKKTEIWQCFEQCVLNVCGVFELSSIETHTQSNNHSN